MIFFVGEVSVTQLLSGFYCSLLDSYLGTTHF